MLTAALDKTVLLWEVPSGKVLKTFREGAPCYAVLFHPTNNNFFAVCLVSLPIPSRLDSTPFLWFFLFFLLVLVLLLFLFFFFLFSFFLFLFLLFLFLFFLFFFYYCIFLLLYPCSSALSCYPPSSFMLPHLLLTPRWQVAKVWSSSTM